MQDGSPQFGLVIVGDEILLGKRQDAHFACMRHALKARGLSLSWVRVVGDEPALLEATFREVFASGAAVFSCGGIGITPDDLTRQAVAKAAALPLQVHPEGLALLQAKFGAALNAQRQRLVAFPQGATLIPNPINQVPGFSLFPRGEKQAGLHFLPGFPQMAAAMIEWLLDHYYAAWFRADANTEALIRVLGVAESELIPLINAVAAAYPAVKIACLPDSRREGVVELGLRGEAAMSNAAAKLMAMQLSQAGFRFSE